MHIIKQKWMSINQQKIFKLFRAYYYKTIEKQFPPLFQQHNLDYNFHILSVYMKSNNIFLHYYFIFKRQIPLCMYKCILNHSILI